MSGGPDGNDQYKGTITREEELALSQLKAYSIVSKASHTKAKSIVASSHPGAFVMRILTHSRRATTIHDKTRSVRMRE